MSADVLVTGLIVMAAAVVLGGLVAWLWSREVQSCERAITPELHVRCRLCPAFLPTSDGPRWVEHYMERHPEAPLANFAEAPEAQVEAWRAEVEKRRAWERIAEEAAGQVWVEQRATGRFAPALKEETVGNDNVKQAAVPKDVAAPRLVALDQAVLEELQALNRRVRVLEDLALRFAVREGLARSEEFRGA